MKRFLLPVLVFLLVFLSGMAAVLWPRLPVQPRRSPPPERKTAAVKNLPPLRLPGETNRRPGAESWEYTGETADNFVTARARILAELLHRSWRPEREIPLEESLSPCVLLTFRRADVELVLMLWKIDGGTTGFSYRREKIVNPEVETL